MSQFVKVGLTDVQKCCSVIGLFDRDVAVIEMALRRGIPCATVIGGGYDDDIDVLGRRHSIIHRAAIKVNHKKKTAGLYSLGSKGMQVVCGKELLDRFGLV